MPLLLWLTLPAAHADAPHPAAVHIVAPAEDTVLTDWSAPLAVSAVLTLQGADFTRFRCEYFLDGRQVYTGTLTAAGVCNATLDISLLAPGRHKLTAHIPLIDGDKSFQASVGIALNGVPQVSASVEGTCLADAHSDLYVVDVTVDDAFCDASGPGALSRAENVTVSATLYEADGSTSTGIEASTTVTTDAYGHGTGQIYLPAPPDGVGPYTWLVTAVDPAGATGTSPADGVPSGYLAIDAPPVPTWYDSVAEASDTPVTGLTWSNDTEHSPYGILVTLQDADDGTAADIVSVLLTSTTSGGTDHIYQCADAYGYSYYCDPGADGWTLNIPSADLGLDTYDVTLLTADQCTTTDPLVLTIAPEEDVDNDRDGVAESGVGPDHDCDDDDVDNAAAADAAEAFGNETDVDAEAMTGDPASGYTASGNLHNSGDVDWWAFEVSGDEVGRGNISFSVELIVPGDGVTPYGDWSVVAETNIANGTSPSSDTSTPTITIDPPDCASGTTCIYRATISGDSDQDGELYWWLAVNASVWSPAMCDDLGVAYSLQVHE